MKIRSDFVTNSSSTSFILSIKDKFSEENFMKAIGVEENEDMKDFFENLFLAIDANKQDIYEAMKSCEVGYGSAEEFLRGEGFDEETVAIVKRFQQENRKVYFGRLASDGTHGFGMEVYFCGESFVFCDDEIYFNGRNYGW